MRGETPIDLLIRESLSRFEHPRFTEAFEGSVNGTYSFMYDLMYERKGMYTWYKSVIFKSLLSSTRLSLLALKRAALKERTFGKLT